MSFKIKDKKPLLFQKTDSNIWTDPHIGKQMLNEHLNPSSDSATRNEKSVTKIIELITRYSQPGSHLLDLGCGPGIYTSILKDKDFEVTGVDFNTASIEYASSRRKDIKYIRADYISQYPEGRFDTIIMIYCDMGTHSDTDRDCLLNQIYLSLNEDGILIFDVFTDDLIFDRDESKNWEYHPTEGFWHDEEYLLLTQHFHYPEEQAYATQYNLLTKDENKHFIVWDRYYNENEIKDILTRVGFSEVIIERNLLTGNNFTSNNQMFIIAKK